MGSLNKIRKICSYPRCYKYFRFRPWADEVDRTNCPQHRRLIREAEAERIVAEREKQEAARLASETWQNKI